MTELEILAQLKTAYLSLEDINENHGGQLTENEEKYIRLSMQNLEILYDNTYKKIQNENEKKLYFKKNLLIANKIYFDYITKSEDYDDQYLTYADVDEKKWWEDEEFLTKM